MSNRHHPGLATVDLFEAIQVAAADDDEPTDAKEDAAVDAAWAAHRAGLSSPLDEVRRRVLDPEAGRDRARRR